LDDAYKPPMQQADHRRDRNARDNRRRGHPPRSPAERRPETVWIYGFHPVLAALANPRRTVRRLLATPNALRRLTEAGAHPPVAPEETTPRLLDRLLGGDAVHQGVAIEASPLTPALLAGTAGARLVVVLDQITDPHNVGAIARSAVAFGAAAIITTGRHSPVETGVLAKAASGGLDQIDWVEVGNLARALEELGAMGFTRIGLDSAGELALDEAQAGSKIALVLGAEGKGLRQRTRETCDVVARLPVSGAIASLNVSNAAVLALYIVTRHLDSAGK
jgi:23S rRNA (guanosine2251-2'-O)-methyltransferase